MKRVDVDRATESLADYVHRLEDEPLIVTSDGHPVAALVSVGNADGETISLSTNPNFIKLIQQARRRHKKEGGVSSDDVRRLLKLDRKRKSPARAR